jgi:hypothetical protein
MTAGARREAAETLRRVIELLPKLSPGQRDYLEGVASGLDLKVSRHSRGPSKGHPGEGASGTDSAKRK